MICIVSFSLCQYGRVDAVLGFAAIASGLTHTLSNEGNAMNQHAATETNGEAAVLPAVPADATAAATKRSDRHKLVADISVFHYKRLRMVASERGIPVGELLEELVDRMWTYRSG